MAELLIYEDVVSPEESGFWGGGVDAKTFAAQLKGDEPLTVRINSYGGDVANGLAIYNLLLAERRKGRKVITVIDGAAFSIASVIAMAGDEVHMAEAAQLMVHKPWCFCGGNADEMRAKADMLDETQAAIMPAYQQKTGMGAEALNALLTAETFLCSGPALELKFIDKILTAPERPAAQASARKVWGRHPIAHYFAQQQEQRMKTQRPRAEGEDPKKDDEDEKEKEKPENAAEEGDEGGGEHQEPDGDEPKDLAQAKAVIAGLKAANAHLLQRVESLEAEQPKLAQKVQEREAKIRAEVEGWQKDGKIPAGSASLTEWLEKHRAGTAAGVVAHIKRGTYTAAQRLRGGAVGTETEIETRRAAAKAKAEGGKVTYIDQFAERLRAENRTPRS